jgi:hypothetical protein
MGLFVCLKIAPRLELSRNTSAMRITHSLGTRIDHARSRGGLENIRNASSIGALSHHKLMAVKLKSPDEERDRPLRILVMRAMY